MTSKDTDTDFQPIDTGTLEAENEKNIKEFSELLDTLSSLHDKKKALWKQIYNNAVIDRSNAYIMYSDLYAKVHGSDAAHACHGQHLVNYLGQMSKANAQLIKLAEILDEAVEADEELETDEDAMYERIKRQQE